MNMLSRILKNERKILVIAIILSVAVMTGLSWWKLEAYRYNAIDLAYYNQAMWRTVHGDVFGLTIHPHKTLGDHIEPILPLFAPLYALLPHPLTLLFLQSLALGVAAVPLFLIAKVFVAKEENIPGATTRARRDGAQREGGRGGGFQRCLPLLIALLWLANPLVHNANLFEFHILPFAIAPLLAAFLFFERRDLPRFLLWSVVAMMVREDVPLVVGAFAVLGAIGVLRKERTLRWIIAPLAISIPWFVGTQALTHLFSSDGAYKFFVYYAWMGESASAIIHNIFLDPLRFVRHIADLNLLLFFLELGMPFLFLFLLRPRALILTLPALLPHLLASYRATPLVAETHYVALLLPGVAIAAAAALMHPPRWVRQPTLVILAVAAALYAVITMSPMLPILRLDRSIERAAVRDTFIARIPPDAAVATTESFLTALSGREIVVLMRYVYAGATQYGKANYALRPDIQYILLDLRDVIAYDTKGTAALAKELRAFGVVAVDEQFVLLARGAGASFLADTPVNSDAYHQERVAPCPVGDASSCIRLTMTVQPTTERRLLLWGDALLPIGYNLVTDPPLASTYWLSDNGIIPTLSIASWTALQTLMPDRAVTLDYHVEPIK